jgi:hypothetical protein
MGHILWIIFTIIYKLAILNIGIGIILFIWACNGTVRRETRSERFMHTVEILLQSLVIFAITIYILIVL